MQKVEPFVLCNNCRHWDTEEAPPDTIDFPDHGSCTRMAVVTDGDETAILEAHGETTGWETRLVFATPKYFGCALGDARETAHDEFP